MNKFKLKGQQLRDKHLREMMKKLIVSGIYFRIRNNAKVFSRVLCMEAYEVKI